LKKFLYKCGFIFIFYQIYNKNTAHPVNIAAYPKYIDIHFFIGYNLDKASLKELRW